MRPLVYIEEAKDCIYIYTDRLTFVIVFLSLDVYMYVLCTYLFAYNKQQETSSFFFSLSKNGDSVSAGAVLLSLGGQLVC